MRRSEILFWAERPSPLGFARTRINRALKSLTLVVPGSLMVGILLTSFRYSSGWGEWTLGFFGSLLNTASICFILHACSALLNGSRTLYAITDWRVLALTRNRQGFTTQTNDDLSSYMLSSMECMNSTGDVLFWDYAESRWISESAKQGMWISLNFPDLDAFSGVKNPRDVERLIRDIFGV